MTSVAAWARVDRDALAAAERALLGGDPAAAERLAAPLLRRRPAEAALHRLVATARRRRGELTGAAEAYRVAEALAPDDPAILVDHASLLDRLGQPEQARQRYERVLAQTPEHQQALLGMALALKHLGRFDEALAAVARGLAGQPGDTRLLQTQGAILRELGESDDAARAFDAVLARVPDDLGALRGRAQVAADAGRPAAAWYERAVAHAPADPELRLGLAVAQANEGRAAEAIAALATLLRGTPTWIAGHGTLARLRWLNEGPGRFDEGFRVALAAAPRHLPLWTAWLHALARAGRHAEVVALAGQARANAGTSAELDLVEASSASEGGDAAHADALFARLPDDGHEALALRLAHLLRSGRPGEAAALAQARISDAAAPGLLPYLETAWRLLGDPRADALLGEPRLVSTARLDVDLDALARVLRRLHLARHAPVDQSLRQGTQTEGPLLSHADPTIRELRGAVLAAADAHLAQLPPADPAHPLLRQRPIRLRVAGSWSVRLAEGGYHVAHVHPEGWLSSAFYVALPPGMGDGKGRHDGWLVLGEPPAGLAGTLPPRRLIEPEPGLLALFPSIMWHGTRRFGTGERLTAAFDLVPRL